ncbi:trihelix transcription factor PTL-like [Telopea speciosissima]|uniref:trihelix transcription factor PTL-like n=1 Tax=Telopea speciosissima TaxID=54955 RepID=UPI001CC722A6|nr:trihelix transcription factor PTL-like [Telopea speciosissima]
MEMEEEQYGWPDLRQLMGGRTHFPAVPQGTVQFSSHMDLTREQHYEMIMGDRQVAGEMFPRTVLDFRPDSTSTSAAPRCRLDMEACIVGDVGNGRWPRQETLTLLEIRSRLDPKFKEANQKGPLWDEISRIMAEEHGYQRSGKKCREKFENLYKYYKKTKEGKAGRQDGKNYRFFRQLEALYGETTTTTTPVPETQTHLAPHSLGFQPTSQSSPKGKQCESLISLSNSSDLDSSSSEEEKLEESHSHRKRKSWKAKIRDFMDSQMRRLVETQEAWLEKTLKTLERKEQERLFREEAWQKEESTRLAREFKFWAHERAWVEARDASLMEALEKFTGRELKASTPEELVGTHENSENQNENGSDTVDDSAKSCKENSRNKASNIGSEEQRGNAVQDSCFRYLMTAPEEEPLWENYDDAIKLNKGEK